MQLTKTVSQLSFFPLNLAVKVYKQNNTKRAKENLAFSLIEIAVVKTVAYFWDVQKMKQAIIAAINAENSNEKRERRQ